MRASRTLVSVLVLAGCCARVCAQDVLALSEQDFLSEMPIVLSVSRLPQRLDEAPGAVTLIDRDMIRLSGARDVADLLRLVPGFQSSTSFESGAPLASYHGGFDSYAKRMQVLVDGRSVYSPYFMGSIGPGLQVVSLEDIERIEVLRGSNSAAYGARAFLGVVNIVTRDPAETVGASVDLAAGENRVRDLGMRLGWSGPRASVRLSLQRRADDGLAQSNGANRVQRFNARADVQLAAHDQLELRAGHLAIDAGKGFVGQAGDAPRDTAFTQAYTQIEWRRTLDADSDLLLSLSHTQEDYQDSFPFSLAMFGIPDSIDVSYSGRARSDNLAVQHIFRQGTQLRVVWGGEWRREQVLSRPLYNTDAALANRFVRVFTNAEWSVRPDLVLNAGGLIEHITGQGQRLAPRWMINWHATPAHTWRVGGSTAFRPPSAYEQSADVRYAWNGHLLKVTTLSSGRVEPEKLTAHEIGYLAQYPDQGVSLDARLFHERFDGMITQLNSQPIKDYANTENFSIRGLEYQLKWKPWSGAQFNLNQAWTQLSLREHGADGSDYGAALPAPRLATTLSWMQKLPYGLDLSISHQNSTVVTPQGGSRDDQAAFARTDVRLGAPFNWNGRRGDAAVVIQNLGPAYTDYNALFQFQRRAFFTLRLEN